LIIVIVSSVLMRYFSNDSHRTIGTHIQWRCDRVEDDKVFVCFFFLVKPKRHQWTYELRNPLARDLYTLRPITFQLQYISATLRIGSSRSNSQYIHTHRYIIHNVRFGSHGESSDDEITIRVVIGLFFRF